MFVIDKLTTLAIICVQCIISYTHYQEYIAIVGEESILNVVHCVCTMCKM